MYHVAKFYVLRRLTVPLRYSTIKGGPVEGKDGKGDSKCSPKKKADLCADKKGDKGGADGKAGKDEKGSKDEKGCKVAMESKDGKAGKDSKDGKEAKAMKCGGVTPTDGKKAESLGGPGREPSCKAKKKPPTKGSSTAGALRKICLFGVIPAVVALNVLVFATRTHEEREEFKKWPHLYKRDKPFPWGDGVKSFFHNPHTNPLPETGYEDE
ncbi:uncharacterized protein LOC101462934 [Ceratitis capitata]|nr:uncharacterized protein LOC101462934 [Ceratitis capitata]